MWLRQWESSRWETNPRLDWTRRRPKTRAAPQVRLLSRMRDYEVIAC